MKTEKVNLGGRMCIPLSRNFAPRGNSVYILFISSELIPSSKWQLKLAQTVLLVLL